MEDLLQRHFLLLFVPLYRGFTTASLFASFFDPSIYVVMLYAIVEGVNSFRVESCLLASLVDNNK